MAEYASKGVAGAGLGLGIAGTALGVLAGGSNGLLGGLFGGNAASQYATKEELTMAQELANRDHQIAALTAEKYTDQAVQEAMTREAKINETIRDMAIANEKNIALIKADQASMNTTINHHATVIEELAREAASARVREQATTDAVNALGQSTTDRFSAVYASIAAAKADTAAAIALESERRVNGDQSITAYVNATFVPGKMVMPISSVCPQPMPANNSWSCPDSGCGCSSNS